MSTKHLNLKPPPTPAELLLIARRRLKETQIDSAHRHDVSARSYIQWERGVVDIPFPVTLSHVPTVVEKLLVLRRRHNLKQADLADKIGCCRWWLNQMERGIAPVGDLLNFWKNYGQRVKSGQR